MWRNFITQPCSSTQELWRLYSYFLPFLHTIPTPGSRSWGRLGSHASVLPHHHPALTPRQPRSKAAGPGQKEPQHSVRPPAGTPSLGACFKSTSSHWRIRDPSSCCQRVVVKVSNPSVLFTPFYGVKEDLWVTHRTSMSKNISLQLTAPLSMLSSRSSS